MASFIRQQSLITIAPDIGAIIKVEGLSDEFCVVGWLRKHDYINCGTMLEGVLNKGVNELYGRNLAWCARSAASHLHLQRIPIEDDSDNIVVPVYACKITRPASDNFIDIQIIKQRQNDKVVQKLMFTEK